MNCHNFGGKTHLRHLQSMILATDRAGLFVLLAPASETLTKCPTDKKDAISIELKITEKIRAAGAYFLIPRFA